MRTVFIKFNKINDIIISDKTINNSYSYLETHKNCLGFTIKGGWREHSWTSTYKLDKLSDYVYNTYIVKDNIVYYKPNVYIKTIDNEYKKEFFTYNEALDYARSIRDNKVDFELNLP